MTGLYETQSPEFNGVRPHDLEVMKSLTRIETRQTDIHGRVIETQQASREHSHILRYHGERLSSLEAKSSSPPKDGHMSEVWLRVLGGVILTLALYLLQAPAETIKAVAGFLLHR